MTKNNSKLNICVFCGARPNFIKVAPIVRLLDKMQTEGKEKENMSCSMVYAGREDDPTLEDQLFSDLSIRRPDAFLGVECKNLNELTGQVMAKFESYLQNHPTNVVIVVDDLASTMAAAIVTKKQALTLVHLAAGTRSFDITMPKEINRLVIDGLSDILFTAGLSNNSIANKEGAELSKVYMVGNILIDNIRFNRERMAKLDIHKMLAFEKLGLSPKNYLVFTLNRQALINDDANLLAMLKSLLKRASQITIVAPLRKMAAEKVITLIRENQLKTDNLHIINPLGYLEFGTLLANAKGVITDSGNVAEEATFDNVPCITLNRYTEHIETVKNGTNVLVGEDATELGRFLDDMLADKWKAASIPDRWDGRSAERIVQILIEHCS